MDSYNLFYATLLLTGGTLGDLYGRARVFAIGIGLIVLGSIVCAAAPNSAILIAGRAITGIGSALEVPTSLAILTAASPMILAPAIARVMAGVLFLWWQRRRPGALAAPAFIRGDTLEQKGG